MEDSTIETEARILNTRRSALKGAAALLALGTLPVTTSGPAVEASSVNSPPPIEAGKEDVSLWGQILRLSSEVKEISRGGRFDDAAKNIAHLIAYCKTQGAVLSEVAADIQKRLPSYSPEIRCSCPDKERILAIVKDIGAGTLGGYLLSEGCSATDAHHSGMFVRASKMRTCSRSCSGGRHERTWSNTRITLFNLSAIENLPKHSIKNITTGSSFGNAIFAFKLSLP